MVICKPLAVPMTTPNPKAISIEWRYGANSRTTACSNRAAASSIHAAIRSSSTPLPSCTIADLMAMDTNAEAAMVGVKPPSVACA